MGRWAQRGQTTITTDELNFIHCREMRLALLMMSRNFRQKYSHYVPIVSKSKSQRKMSGVKGDDIRSAREAAKSASLEAPKRRSTMNSRATLDEDEMLRKALEISKQEGGVVSEHSIVRKSKRGRDESEE